jgi:hypothetical protein
MTTTCTKLDLEQPIRFLGATVLSFNTSLGFGSEESTLSVELVEDCERNPPDAFEPNKTPPTIEVGAPVFFKAGDFTVGGVLSSWTVRKSTAGMVYNARVTDPKPLLANAVAIIDSYNGPPLQGANYFNVYHFWEGVLCRDYGLSLTTEQGTPYQRIRDGLNQMLPVLCSPTGYRFTIDFSTFPGGANSQIPNFPAFYRIQGPSVTLLDLIQDACDTVGFDFFVYLEEGVGGADPIIKVGVVNLRQPPTSFLNIINSFETVGTDLSYGQELRNEPTKTMIIGESVHYLTKVDRFYPFFGEDIFLDTSVTPSIERAKPVIPYNWDALGFWISKKVDSLNSMLENPLPTDGPYQIHELDIRCAMASFKSWIIRTMNPNTLGSFNTMLRGKYGNVVFPNPNQFLDAMGGEASQFEIDDQNFARAAPDWLNMPRPQINNANNPNLIEELETIHKWLADLGNTYYGKQYLGELQENICYYLTDYLANDGQLVFSSVPTSAGGWVDPNTPVLQLGDPELELFKLEDGRLGSFAVFKTDGDVPDDSDDNGEFGAPPAVPPFNNPD